LTGAAATEFPLLVVVGTTPAAGPKLCHNLSMLAGIFCDKDVAAAASVATGADGLALPTCNPTGVDESCCCCWLGRGIMKVSRAESCTSVVVVVNGLIRPGTALSTGLERNAAAAAADGLMGTVETSFKEADGRVESEENDVAGPAGLIDPAVCCCCWQSPS
jgi:hypothetical protein